MFENFFTTKMSLDKKKLAGRFYKISSRTKKSTKFICAMCFLLVIAVIAAISIFMATANSNKLMSEKAFEEYTKRPVGAVMAELDYADDEKVVFHYLDGLFVYDMQKGEISYAFDLKKLNVGYNMQGDTILAVTVANDGKTAYLSTVGNAENLEDFDTYRLDLESGKAHKEKIAQGIVEFDGFSDAATAGVRIGGWHSDKVVINNNKIYALAIRDNLLGSLELVTFENGDTRGKYTYIFDTLYRNSDDLKLEKIKLYIKSGSEILWGDRNSFETNVSKLHSVSQIFDGKLSESIAKLEDGNYDAVFVPVVTENVTEMYLFVFDNYTFEIATYGTITNEQCASALETLFHQNTLVEEKSELYSLTESYLEKEFVKAYSPYYDIVSLTITSWNESADGTEATFGYRMIHKNYNRDPDTVDYIKKAKEQSSYEHYMRLYEDYLAEKNGNYFFKVVRDGDALLLYSNDLPTGIDWRPVKVSDYILGQ